MSSTLSSNLDRIFIHIKISFNQLKISYHSKTLKKKKLSNYNYMFKSLKRNLYVSLINTIQSSILIHIQ